jgi:hypothetical protein
MIDLRIPLFGLVGLSLGGGSALAYEVPKEYCEALQANDALLRKADAQFTDWSARKKWLAPRQKAINDKVTKAIGREKSVWFAEALEQEWDEICEAASLGRPAVRVDHLKAAAEKDRALARAFLELNYVQRLNEGSEPFFDNEQFTSVNCAETEWEKIQFIGCKLRSFTRSTDRDMFVAANVDGEVIIVPVDAQAKSRVSGLRSFDKSSVDGTPTLRIGHLAGNFSFVDYPTVKRALE